MRLWVCERERQRRNSPRGWERDREETHPEGGRGTEKKLTPRVGEGEVGGSVVLCGVVWCGVVVVAMAKARGVGRTSSDHVRMHEAKDKPTMQRREGRGRVEAANDGGKDVWEPEMSLAPDTRVANANALKKAMALASVFGGMTVGIGITGSRWNVWEYLVPLGYVLLALGFTTQRNWQRNFAFQGQSLSKQIFQNVMAYVMFWTLASNFCHVFV